MIGSPFLRPRKTQKGLSECGQGIGGLGLFAEIRRTPPATADFRPQDQIGH